MNEPRPPLHLKLAILHKQLLREKLLEIHRLLGLEDLESAWVVTPEEFRNSIQRCDAALDRLTGVARGIRRLVWLSEVLECMAAETKGRPWIKGEPLSLPLSALGRFAQELLAVIPARPEEPQNSNATSATPGESTPGRHDSRSNAGNTVVVRYVGQYLAACVASRHRGRRPRGTRSVPEKWVAFRALAEHLGLISSAVPVDSLRRQVLRGRQQLKVGRPKG